MSEDIISATAQEPVAWKHSCAALLVDGVELWIDNCPHCGKPRTAPAQPQPTQQLLDTLQSMRVEAWYDHDVEAITVYSSDDGSFVYYDTVVALVGKCLPAQPQVREHDLADRRCQSCGYMTYHREHMGCIRAAQPQVREPLDDNCVRRRISELGNMIHNLGCEYQNNKPLSTRLNELASQAWGIAKAQPQVPEGAHQMLTAVQAVLQRAYNSANPACCGQSRSFECCGQPVPEWSEYDQRIMNDLQPIEKWLQAILTASQEQS